MTKVKIMKDAKDDQTLIRKRTRRLAGKLMEDSSLRSHLTDEKGQQLLDWGIAQVKAKVAETADLPEEEMEQSLEEAVTAVRMVMHSVNHLMGPETETADSGLLTPDHLLDERTTRLLKNLSWLTGQPSGIRRLMHLQRFNQDRADPEAAFQHLMTLLQSATGSETAEQTTPAPETAEPTTAPLPESDV